MLVMRIAVIFAIAFGCVRMTPAQSKLDYNAARWDPIHFKPAILTAENHDCLKCHSEIMDEKVLAESQAGLKASEALAWYQTLDTYHGEQKSFHWRHLQSPYANQVMNLKCNFCHQGNDPREEAPSPPTGEQTGFTLRKMVDVQETCLKCHGTMNWQVMNLPSPLPGPWPTCRDYYQNDCLSCHAIYRNVRHQVSYLQAEKIEELAKPTNLGGDVCYGCHGGRAWYREGYPYPRHPYPAMNTIPNSHPEWAKERPTESDPRYALPIPELPVGSAPATTAPLDSPSVSEVPANTSQAVVAGASEGSTTKLTSIPTALLGAEPVAIAKTSANVDPLSASENSETKE